MLFKKKEDRLMKEETSNEIEEEKTLKEEVHEIHSLLNPIDKKKIERLKIPRKAKINKNKMKKGWIGLLFVNPNRVVIGEKVKLEGGTYKTKDGNYHVTDGHEIAFWEGKYPFIWQRYDKLNPTNLFPKENEKNEMYGQDMIMLRMKKDLIKEKKSGGLGWIYIIIILVGGYFLIKAFFPNLFGGA